MRKLVFAVTLVLLIGIPVISGCAGTAPPPQPAPPPASGTRNANGTWNGKDSIAFRPCPAYYSRRAVAEDRTKGQYTHYRYEAGCRNCFCGGSYKRGNSRSICGDTK
jgi:hypothetical protein